MVKGRILTLRKVTMLRQHALFNIKQVGGLLLLPCQKPEQKMSVKNLYLQSGENIYLFIFIFIYGENRKAFAIPDSERIEYN